VGFSSSWLGRNALLRRPGWEGGRAAVAAAEAVDLGGNAPPRISSVQCSRGVARAMSLGSLSLHAHRCVLGVSPPRCSRVSLASFSSRPLQAGIDLFKLDQRIAASTTLQEVLSEVRESHSDFRPRNAATACRRLAKYLTDPSQKTLKSARLGKRARAEGQVQHVRAFLESDQDKATFQLAIQAAKRTASGMNPQDVSITLWGFKKLVYKSMEVDAAAVGAVSEQARRVAGEMNPRETSFTLWGFAKLAEKGVEVDAAAVRAVSEQARRVAGEMNPKEISLTLWGFVKLAGKGVEVDAAAVRAVSAQVPRVAGELTEHNISITLLAWSRFAESGIPLTSILDGSWRTPEVDAVLARAKEVWPQMTPPMNIGRFQSKV